MKEKLLILLQNSPATAGRPDDFLDALADDIQAVIIRAIHPANTDDAVTALEAEVEEVYGSDFGVHLFNLYTTENFPGKKEPLLTFSARKRLVRAMIQTLLVEQCVDYDCDADDIPALFGTDGNTLKRRLRELSAEPPTGLPN